MLINILLHLSKKKDIQCYCQLHGAESTKPKTNIIRIDQGFLLNNMQRSLGRLLDNAYLLTDLRCKGAYIDT